MDSGNKDAGNNESFDRERSIKFLNGNEELFKEVSKLFLNSYEQNLHKLELAISEKEFPEIKKWSHKIKGGIGYFLYDPANKLALTLEKKGENQDANGLHPLLDDFKKEIDYLVKELKKC